MSVKAILVLCSQVLLVKSALGQSCTSRAAIAATSRFAVPARTYDGLAYPAAGFSGSGLVYDGLNAGCAGRALAYDATCAPAMEFSPTSGGALPVSSASTIAPVGISVASDNVYEGVLAVGGELPFVGTVAMEGVVPSAGVGAVNHACGNGRNAMISETAAFGPAAIMAPLAAYSPAATIAPVSLATPNFGLRRGLAGRTCGCGV